MINLAIFASGRGSNALKIIEHLKTHPTIKVVLIISNKKEAKVLDIAKQHNIKNHVVNRDDFYKNKNILKKLSKNGVNWIVLAGFLWLVPAYIVNIYPYRILNIHPALLPKYGGKGMYGINVHRAVKTSNEKESGISIHYVNAQYDEGDIIFQAKCSIEPTNTVEDIAQKVLQLEHHFFPSVVEASILSSVND